MFLPLCYCPLQEIRKYGCVTDEVPTDIVIIPSSVKMDYLLRKLRETARTHTRAHTHTHQLHYDFISLFISLRHESWLKMVQKLPVF